MWGQQSLSRRPIDMTKSAHLPPQVSTSHHGQASCGQDWQGGDSLCHLGKAVIFERPLHLGGRGLNPGGIASTFNGKDPFPGKLFTVTLNVDTAFIICSANFPFNNRMIGIFRQTLILSISRPWHLPVVDEMGKTVRHEASGLDVGRIDLGFVLLTQKRGHGHAR